MFDIKKLFSFRLPVCPSCKKKKDKNETFTTQQLIASLFDEQDSWTDFLYSGSVDIAYKRFTSGESWACDECLQSGAALLAAPSSQKFCFWPPFLAYLDSHKKCSTCEVQFLFSKEEKQYWYETLGFWVQSKAVHCKACRAENRARKKRISDAQRRLQEILPKIDRKNPEHIKEVIALYRQSQSHRKVEHYSCLLKKLEKIQTKS